MKKDLLLAYASFIETLQNINVELMKTISNSEFAECQKDDIMIIINSNISEIRNYQIMFEKKLKDEQ